jgi:AraC-like DNA-binding protein
METSTKIGVKDDKKYIVSPFYKQFKAHLSAYFKNVQNLEKAAHQRSSKDGLFLEQVNKEILTHLDQETFDTQALSKAIGLSRSQLYRRLYPLTRLAPSKYIRFVRLQQAKELMEKEDLTVGEAAFRTGFVNLSHFTRVFRQQFGFNPSHFRKLCQENKA